MPREIGWSQESNLLYQIKQLLSRTSGGGGGSSTPAVETYATYSTFPVAGVTGTFYIDGSSGNEYVWDGTKYIYVQSRQSPAPSFPYSPSITYNVGPEGRLSGVTYDRNYNAFWSYPIVQKQYPDPSLNAIVYVIPVSLGSPYTGQTSGSLNNVVAAIISSFSTTNLTSVTFRDLKYILGTSATSMTLSNTIASISFPELLFIASGFTFGGTPALTTLSFPKLEVMGTFTNNILTITSYSFPELLEMSGLFTDTSTAVTSYSFPKLKVGTAFTLTGTKSSLTSITLPAIEYIGGTITFPTTSAALTTFTFGPTLKAYGTTAGNFVTTSNSLNQASVDNILIRLAALDGTGGTILFSSRTVTITGGAATPSAAGIAAKNTLIARGCTVTTN